MHQLRAKRSKCPKNTKSGAREFRGIEALDLAVATERTTSYAKSYLHHRHNLTTHTHRLSAEILTEIFRYVQAKNTENYYWMKITCICHYWREVALNASFLWSTILVGEKLSMKGLQEMLRRSGTCGLHVIVEPLWHDKWRTVLAHFARIETLEIKATDDMPLEPIMDELPVSAPRLKTFRIKVQNTFTDYESDSDASDFGNDRPHAVAQDVLKEVNMLRCVELSRCILNCNAPILRAPLTHLDLSHIIWEEPIGQLSAILFPVASTLQSLTLNNSLRNWQFASRETATQESIYLGQLRELTLQGKPTEIRHLLSSITFPSSTRVAIDLNWQPSQDVSSPFSPVFNALALAYSSYPTDDHFRSCTISKHFPHYPYQVSRVQFFQRQSSRTDIGSGSDPAAPGGSLTLNFDWQHDEEARNYAALWTIWTLVHDIFQSDLPFDTLENLDMSRISCGGDPAVLAHIFTKLTGVKTISVDKETVKTLFELIQLPRRFPSIPAVFPELRTVHISNVTLRRYADVTGCMLGAQLLTNALKYRRQSHHPITRIVLSSCKFSDDLIEDIENLEPITAFERPHDESDEESGNESDDETDD